jgi:hypothetical protein
MDDGASIFVIAIIGLAIWLNVSSNFIKNETTIYELQCSKELVNGICKTTSYAFSYFTYKTFDDKQSVIFWINDGEPSKFSNCAVRDYKKWACTESTALGDIEHIMNDGEYRVNDYRTDLAMKNIFNTYQVPKWKWYYYYLTGGH